MTTRSLHLVTCGSWALAWDREDWWTMERWTERRFWFTCVKLEVPSEQVGTCVSDYAALSAHLPVPLQQFPTHPSSISSNALLLPARFSFLAGVCLFQHWSCGEVGGFKSYKRRQISKECSDYLIWECEGEQVSIRTHWILACPTVCMVVVFTEL
jgi:hypothetical protein